jgi:dolichol-phosphate mannosyltransferase
MYNEAGNVPDVVRRLRSALSDEGAAEIIFVDDGSTDDTWEAIGRAAASDRGVRGVRLSRNFGHQSALLAGLSRADGAAVIMLDGDLQHPPEITGKLLEKWREGYKIVNAIRQDTRETGFFKRTTSRLFYRFFSAISGLRMSPGSADFRLLDRSVVPSVLGMRDADLFLRGLVQWVGFPTATVTYTPEERHAGESKYGLRRMFRFAVSAVLAFSLGPLKLGIWVGLLTSLLAFAEIVYILVRYVQGETVPGWASLMGVMSFMFGVLFILLGIIGTYLGSVFEILKNRPHFIIGSTVGFDERPAE